MLVLTRRAGESLMIGDEIEISIIEVQGDKAKIGITAPKDVRILRRELIDEVRSTNAPAASVTVSLDDLAQALSGEDGGR
jgi:carbon storage regulator